MPPKEAKRLVIKYTNYYFYYIRSLSIPLIITKESLLMQYQFGYYLALKSVVNVRKPLKNFHGYNEIIHGHTGSQQILSVR